jgi:hypothetical protein
MATKTRRHEEIEAPVIGQAHQPLCLSYNSRKSTLINRRAARKVGIHEEDQCHTIISFVARNINEEIAALGIVYCEAAACRALSNNQVIAVAAASSCLRDFVANSCFLP